MKIKCPVCDDEERHQYDDEPVKEHDEEYHKLIQKIHKKIDEYRGFEWHFDPSVSIEHLLKSLLENDQK